MLIRITSRSNRTLYSQGHLHGKVVDGSFVPEPTPSHSGHASAAVTPSDAPCNLLECLSHPLTLISPCFSFPPLTLCLWFFPVGFPTLIGLWNARSLMCKLSFFQSLFYSKPYGVFCVTETWLTIAMFSTMRFCHMGTLSIGVTETLVGVEF